MRKDGAATVLVVDDDPAVLSVAQAILKMEGFEVLAAPGGVQALEILEKRLGDIDIILSDVQMPGMDGQELAARVRQIAPAMVCALMSGYSVDSLKNRELPFIGKPFTRAILVTKVREFLFKCN